MGEEKVSSDFTVNPSFKGWPFRSFKQFKEFATEHAGDVYWVAVQLLLERSKRLELYEAGEYPEEDFDEPEEDVEEEIKPIHLGGGNI